MNHSDVAERTRSIAFVDQTGDLAGGAERSLALLLANLPKSLEPIVVLFSDGAYADGLRASGYRVEIIELPGHLLSVQREHLSAADIWEAAIAVRRIRARLRRLNVDLVYTNSVKAHLLAGIAARSLAIPTIAHLRDILTGNGRLLLRTVLRTSTVHRIAISRAVARAYSLSDTTIVVNPLDLQEYAQMPDRNEARTRLGLPLDVPVVGIVGRINRWKGQDAFVRIARLVADKSPAHFAIVGAAVFRDEDFVGELHELAQTLGLADRMHFVPWLTDPRDAFAALDVHCNTSEREPFGRTIIEAAAFGVPTISFDDGGAEDAVAPQLAHDLLHRGDLQGFASAVLRYLEDPAALSSAATIAKCYSKTFDATVHGANIAALVRDVFARVEN